MGKPIVFVWAVLLAVLLSLLLPFKAAATTDLAVVIQDIQPYGDDEVVTIVNTGSAAVDLTGWRLESSNSRGQEVQETFWFPSGCLLPPGGTLRVHSGPYARSWGEERCGYPQIDLPWTPAKVWSDRGDVAWLRDASGNLVDLYTYEAQAAPSPTTAPSPPVYRSKRAPEGAQRPMPECCGACVRPWACTGCGCCAVRVYLEAIELVYDTGYGSNWSFSVSVAGAEPSVAPDDLPRLIYRDVVRGETMLELTATAVEHDLWPDWGYVQQTLRLRCPCHRKIERIVLPVRVPENECPCTGCETLWNFVFRVELEPLKPPIVPRPAPPVDFSIMPTRPYRAGEEVRLEVTAPRPGWRYEWDFNGDGVPDATGPEVRYRLRPGANLITLIATDPQGNRSTITRGIRATERPAVKPSKQLCNWLWVALPLVAIGGLLLWLA